MRVVELKDSGDTIPPQNREIRIIIGKPDWELVKLIFSPVSHDTLFLHTTASISWPLLLTRLGCFSSPREAYKYYKQIGQSVSIGPGYTRLNFVRKEKGKEEEEIKLKVYRPYHNET